jgi:hypothetical protein
MKEEKNCHGGAEKIEMVLFEPDGVCFAFFRAFCTSVANSLKYNFATKFSLPIFTKTKGHAFGNYVPSVTPALFL